MSVVVCVYASAPKAENSVTACRVIVMIYMNKGYSLVDLGSTIQLPRVFLRDVIA